MQEILKAWWNSNFKDFSQKIIFGRLYTCNIYIVTARTSEFTRLYICYKCYPIKKKPSDLEELHTWHRHLTIQIKCSYITNSLCVLFHSKLNFSLKVFVNLWKSFWMLQFKMNFQQRLSVNRTLFKNEMNGMKILLRICFVKNVQRNCCNNS